MKGLFPFVSFVASPLMNKAGSLMNNLLNVETVSDPVLNEIQTGL